MSPAALAWRSLIRQPARGALGVLGIAAVGALLFDMLLLSSGLVVSFGQILDSIGYDVRVTATRSLPTLGPAIERGGEAAQRLRALPEIEEVVALRFGRGETVLQDGSVVTMSLIGAEARARQTWTLLEGRQLREHDGAEPLPILINRNLARRLDLGPGSALRLSGAASGLAPLPPSTFEVVGIARFAYDSADDLTAATLLQGFARAYGDDRHDAADLLLVASARGVGAPAVVARIQQAMPDVHAFSNEELLSNLERNDFSYFRQISFALSTITLFFAFLLVATLLTVSVNQRFAEIAGLRALGFSRRRVAADLIWESTFLVGSGGLLALPLGGLLAGWLDAILRTMPGIPAGLHFFVFQPRAVLLHIVLLCGTGILATLYPLYLAARLPIARTLRKETVS